MQLFKIFHGTDKPSSPVFIDRPRVPRPAPYYAKMRILLSEASSSRKRVFFKNIVIKLRPDLAPNACQYFRALAEGGHVFHFTYGRCVIRRRTIKNDSLHQNFVPAALKNSPDDDNASLYPTRGTIRLGVIDKKMPDWSGHREMHISSGSICGKPMSGGAKNHTYFAQIVDGLEFLDTLTRASLFRQIQWRIGFDMVEFADGLTFALPYE